MSHFIILAWIEGGLLILLDSGMCFLMLEDLNDFPAQNSLAKILNWCFSYLLWARWIISVPHRFLFYPHSLPLASNFSLFHLPWGDITFFYVASALSHSLSYFDTGSCWILLLTIGLHFMRCCVLLASIEL